MKLSELKTNPKNPRLIKDDRFKKLVKSIEDFPKMMELRPIIIDNENMILGGNMRFKALKELKYKEIPDNWVKRADTLTNVEKKEFIIKDNVSFGELDFDILANEWNDLPLDDWGLDIQNFEEQVFNNSEEKNIKENFEINISFDSFDEYIEFKTKFNIH